MKKTWKSIFVGASIMIIPFVSVLSVEAAESNEVETISLLEDNTMKMSPVMTFDEMIAEIANDSGISVEQAEKEFFVTHPQTRKNVRINNYRTFSQKLNVSGTYKPTLKFYCATSESGNFRGIKKVVKTYINRNYYGTSKQFQGNIFVHLKNANRIYYIVNGDFYNNGNTTFSGGVNISLGNQASVSASVSYASNHYKYYYTDGEVTF